MVAVYVLDEVGDTDKKFHAQVRSSSIVNGKDEQWNLCFGCAKCANRTCIPHLTDEIDCAFFAQSPLVRIQVRAGSWQTGGQVILGRIRRWLIPATDGP